MKERSLGGADLRRKAFRRSVRDEFMHRFAQLPEEVRAEHEDRIVDSHKEYVQHERVKVHKPRVGAEPEKTRLGKVFEAVHNSLLF